MLIANAINKISNFLDKVCCAIIIGILAIMVTTTSLQIISRVFFSALSWSEELTRYLLVYLTFLGASSVYKKNGHISVLAIQQLLPPKLQKAASIFVVIIVSVFFTIATFYGLEYMSLQGNQLSAALRIPMKYIYMSIPIGFSIMILHSIDSLINILTGKEELN